jgi:hypothetical protein
MLRRAAVASVALALLGACANSQSNVPEYKRWAKAGAIEDDVKRDLYWCTTTRVRPDTRLNSTPANQIVVRESKVDDECMEQRGYRRIEAAK